MSYKLGCDLNSPENQSTEFCVSPQSFRYSIKGIEIVWIKRDGKAIIIFVGKEAESMAGRSYSGFVVIGPHKSWYKWRANGLIRYIENCQMKMTKAILSFVFLGDDSIELTNKYILFKLWSFYV